VRAAGMTVTLAGVVEYMQPAWLAALARDLPEPVTAKLLGYLEDLTPQQERDLAGARDRLAIIAESDVGRWLDPQTPGEAIDLRTALEQGDLVLFRLDADRLPLAAPMVAGAIMQDLAAICAARQNGRHRPGLLIFDELSAIVVGALAVARLFSRGRGANFSSLVGTQEAADLKSVQVAAAEVSIFEQVAGNIEALVSFRQNLPESAEMVAAIAGTRGAWITTCQTAGGMGALHTGLGSRTRGREYAIHPDEIKSLDGGNAAVIVPRRRLAKIVRVLHPDRGERKEPRC